MLKDLHRAARSGKENLREIIPLLSHPFFRKIEKMSKKSRKGPAQLLRDEAETPSEKRASELLILGAKRKELLLRGIEELEKMELLERERKNALLIQNATIFASSAILVPFILGAASKIIAGLGGNDMFFPLFSYTLINGFIGALFLRPFYGKKAFSVLFLSPVLFFLQGVLF